MANFKKIGGAFFRESDSGELFAVSEMETLQGLKQGHLPYTAVENTHGLTFGGAQSSASSVAQSPAPQQNVAPSPEAESAPGDIGAMIKKKLTDALMNYKGVTSVAEMEQRRQGLLRQQLMAAPYSSEGEDKLTGSAKLSLMRNRGNEFEPEIKGLEEQILAARNGDKEALDMITRLTSLGKEAGIFETEATGYESGIGKEYSDYVRDEKARGNTKIMSLNEYADMDANRKRSVTTIATEGGLNAKQVATFNSLVDKQNKSPLVAAADRTIIVDTVSSQLKSDPKNASLQLSFIYSFIQMLDTYQSAVREGEIGIVSGTQGLSDKLSNLPDKISQGTLLSTDVINKYIGTAKILSDSIKSGASVKKKGFESQAKVSGIEDAWNEYTAGASADTPKTPVTIRVKRIKDGATGSINVDEYDPSVYTKI